MAVRRLFRRGAQEAAATTSDVLAERLSRHRATFEATSGGLAMVGHGQTASYGLDTHDSLERRRRHDVPQLPDDVAASWAVGLLACLADQDGWFTALTLLPAVSRRRLPLDALDVALMLDLANRCDRNWMLDGLKAAVAAAERLDQSAWADLEPRFRLALRNLDQHQSEPSDRARVRSKLRRLIAGASPASGVTVDVSPVHSRDGWGPYAIRRLNSVTEGHGPLSDLLSHAATATSGPRPTKTWEKRMGEIVGVTPDVDVILDDLLDAVLTCPSVIVDLGSGYRYETRVGPDNEDLVRGLIWTARLRDPPWLVPRLQAIAADLMKSDSKLPNACFAALGRIGRPDAVAALAQLQRSTRSRGNLKQIANALGSAAEAAGVSASDLVETAVPDGGLDADGRRRVPLGDVVALLAIEDSGKVTLAYERGGQRLRSLPTEVAAAFASEVAALKRDAAELRRLVATERARLEDLLSEDRSWDLGTWRARYLDHPVTGRLASHLLWRVTTDSHEVTMLGASAPKTPKSAIVRPWHPVHASAGDVQKWRDHLMEHEVTQPFKQAFREVYLLTPAEERTRTYSNRFAAHVLAYQQCYALMKERRWATNYLGPYDGGFEGEATRDFPASGLRAAFFHEQVETNAFQVEYCSTDQVRFTRIGDRSKQPLALSDVPPVIFSEAMRDVDLFVGVTSIAADPAWADRGEHRHYDYWERTAFGELTPTGDTRRDVLERLLPKLKIRDRARIDGRYLVVEGRLHTYKIHLGSGNILMSPNDRYLCIVSARSDTSKGVRFVPFDGDRILSVILSKALMLADDDKITDEAITRQLRD